MEDNQNSLNKALEELKEALITLRMQLSDMAEILKTIKF